MHYDKKKNKVKIDWKIPEFIHMFDLDTSKHVRSPYC